MLFVLRTLPALNLLAVGLTVSEALALLFGSLNRRNRAWATPRNRVLGLLDVVLAALTLTPWASPARSPFVLPVLAGLLAGVQLWKAIETGPRRYAVTRTLRATNVVRLTLWIAVALMAVGLYFGRVSPPVPVTPTPAHTAETVRADVSAPFAVSDAGRSDSPGS